MKVDFIGIGAEKAATSWLAECLKEHPEVCYANIPEGKEIFYFNEFDRHYLKFRNKKYDWGDKWYLKHFTHCDSNSINGEISPTYLYSKVTAQRIKKFNPEIKIIVMLRDPVSRTISQYYHDMSLGVSRRVRFSKALKQNPTLIEKSKYYKYLKYYYKEFPRKQILVIFQEDVASDPFGVLNEVYKFLKLKNRKYKPSCLYRRVNATAVQRIPGLNNLLLQSEYLLMRMNLWILIRLLGIIGLRKFIIRSCYRINLKPVLSVNEISESERTALRKIFISDIKKLEQLINKKLNKWYEAN